MSHEACPGARCVRPGSQLRGEKGLAGHQLSRRRWAIEINGPLKGRRRQDSAAARRHKGKDRIQCQWVDVSFYYVTNWDTRCCPGNIRENVGGPRRCSRPVLEVQRDVGMYVCTYATCARPSVRWGRHRRAVFFSCACTYLLKTGRHWRCIRCSEAVLTLSVPMIQCNIGTGSLS